MLKDLLIMPIKSIHIGKTLPLDKNTEIDNTKNTVNESNFTHFPFIIDARFQYIERLGRGGDGLIYKAFDQVLQRNVALKFLLNPNVNNRIKLVAEARAQANVEHAHICPIYEVIESVEGIYLVMQFVEGENLQELAPSLSIEQLLVVSKKVADGLHVAHTQGLIHRDFKPANVMVNMASNLLDPLIVDFGLAQQGESSEQSPQKYVNNAGTKGFIAPEILAEPNVKLHRRVDVFAFGVCLLYCFTGKLIQSDNDDSLSQHLITTELPKDIQIILAKCMAHKPADRYQSAKDVSQEITRYLNGEPILARSSKGYWLRRKLKKHLWLTLAISTAILGVSGMYTNLLYQAHQQSVREEALLHFNSELKELESQAQLTYMSPRHNIEKDVQQWRSTVEKLESQIPKISPNLLGATHYAIGRKYHVLREHKLAVKHLQIALRLEKNNETAFYLAISLGALYHKELTTLRNITDENLRTSRLTDITKRLKEPAINLLSEYMSSAPHKIYAQALLAYFQEDWDEASKLLNDNSELPSWYYQDDILKGDILLAKAREKYELGENISLINILLEQALKHYEVAEKIAPSDPYLAVKPLSVKASYLLFLNLNGKTAPKEFMDEIFNLERKVKEINGGFYIINQMVGQLLHLYGLNLQYNNGKPEHWFSAAEEKLLQAKELTHADNIIWIILGQHYSDVAKFKMDSNLDPIQSLENAIEALTHVAIEHRDYDYFNALGTLNRYLALQARNDSQASEVYFKSAIDNYLKANNHSPNRVGSLINVASILRKKSEGASNSIRLKEIKKAQVLLEQVIDSNPNEFVANYYLTLIMVDLVDLNLYHDIGNIKYVDLAVQQMAKTKLINNTHPYILDLELRLKQAELEYLFSETKAWVPEFEQLVIDRFKLTEKFSNNTVVIHNYIGTLAVISGYRVQLGLSADFYVTKLQTVINNNPNIKNIEAYHALGELFFHWGTSKVKELNLINKYHLRNKQSIPQKWALFMVLIATATNQSELNEGIALLKESKGQLPIYRDMLLEWADEQASKLTN